MAPSTARSSGSATKRRPRASAGADPRGRSGPKTPGRAGEPLVLREHSDRDALHGVAGKPDRLPHLGREPPQEALQREHLPLAPVARHVAAEQFIGRLAREDLDTLLARELGDQQKRDRVGMGERRSLW